MSGGRGEGGVMTPPRKIKPSSPAEEADETEDIFTPMKLTEIVGRLCDNKLMGLNPRLTEQ